MDVLSYYVNTLSSAFHKLYPIVLFLLGGYFIFIKMPFLFLKKSIDEEKKKLKKEEEMRSLEALKLEPKQKQKIVTDSSNTSRSKEREEPKQEKKQQPPKPSPTSKRSPEEVLGFGPTESFTQAELKKRYFEKLKENHPDRVAMMGEDFKKLAEKNSKEINEAYTKLKKKVA